MADLIPFLVSTQFQKSDNFGNFLKRFAFVLSLSSSSHSSLEILKYFHFQEGKVSIKKLIFLGSWSSVLGIITLEVYLGLVLEGRLRLSEEREADRPRVL